jgi:hypothetical protein
MFKFIIPFIFIFFFMFGEISFLKAQFKKDISFSQKMQTPLTISGEMYYFFYFNKNQKKLVLYVKGELEKFFQSQYTRFFSKPFNRKIEIFLFENKMDYIHATGVEPGYLAHYDKKTGRIYSSLTGEKNEILGALFHENIHLWLTVNIKGAVKLWFQEGFASFFETPLPIKNGHWKFANPNWRQASLREQWTELKTFMQTVDLPYEHSKAQARIIFLWLSEKGLLEKYFKKYMENLDYDNSGMDALKAVTGESMENLDRNLHEYSKKFH